MKNLRLFVFLFAAAAANSACSSGTGEGATNVERGYTKKGPAAHQDGTPAGDSITAGMKRPPAVKVSGKEQFEKADMTTDRNHDGLAD